MPSDCLSHAGHVTPTSYHSLWPAVNPFPTSLSHLTFPAPSWVTHPIPSLTLLLSYFSLEFVACLPTCKQLYFFFFFLIKEKNIMLPPLSEFGSAFLAFSQNKYIKLKNLIKNGRDIIKMQHCHQSLVKSYLKCDFRIAHHISKPTQSFIYKPKDGKKGY